MYIRTKFPLPPLPFPRFPLFLSPAFFIFIFIFIFYNFSLLSIQTPPDPSPSPTPSPSPIPFSSTFNSFLFFKSPNPRFCFFCFSFFLLQNYCDVELTSTKQPVNEAAAAE